MITGAHFVLYSSDAEADRAFFRDVLEFRWVDDGGGWLIFALPPSEVAVHPLGSNPPLVYAGHQFLGVTLHLMCNDLQSVMKSLKAKNVSCTEPDKQPWGTSTTVRLPSGGSIGLYQPTHKTPLGLGSMENFGALQ
jgi:hypothetical protein